MKSRITNLEKVEVLSRSHGDAFECQITPVGTALESKLLGFNVTVIPPGKKAFPYHAHRANEEMFFVLEGEGSVRIDGAVHKIRKGDFISLPPGPDSGHQIVNDSKAPLRYLAVSTMIVPEVVEYPDSGKIMATAGVVASRPATPDSVRHVSRVKDAVDYWEGES